MTAMSSIFVTHVNMDSCTDMAGLDMMEQHLDNRRFLITVSTKYCMIYKRKRDGGEGVKREKR